MNTHKHINSKRKYRKELISIAKLSGSICFNYKMLDEKHKEWSDVSNEIYQIHNTLKEKFARYNSLKSTKFIEHLKAFAKVEIANCEKVIKEHGVP